MESQAKGYLKTWAAALPPSPANVRGSYHALRLQCLLLRRSQAPRHRSQAVMHWKQTHWKQTLRWLWLHPASRWQRLPAPWRPDANIVYAKDYITPLSVDEPEIEQQNASASRTPQLDSPLPAPGTPLSLLQMQAPAALGESGTAESWNYVCDQAAFAEELAEYAMKASAIERQQKRHRWRPRFLG